MKDSTISADATNRANVPVKNKKSPILPGKLLPASRVLWRSGFQYWVNLACHLYLLLYYSIYYILSVLVPTFVIKI